MDSSNNRLPPGDDGTPSCPGGGERQPNYTIFLLTVWSGKAENVNNPQDWRFRLENPRTQERRAFVGTEAMVEGLIKMLSGGGNPVE